MKNSKDELFELFDLCKEVHERFPKLEDENGFYLYTVEGDDEIKRSLWFNVLTFGKGNEKKFTKVPLYTSDYLLSKLPTPVGIVTEDGEHWSAAHLDMFGNSDSPLKALLELTLVLFDKGEING